MKKDREEENSMEEWEKEDDEQGKEARGKVFG